MSEKKTKERSPSFPFIPLGSAIMRLRAFEQTFGRHPAPATKSGLAWGMKDNSSQASQTLAALKAFGLLKYEGSSKDRTASLTEDARTFLRAQQDGIKHDILRKIATKPKQLQKFWAIWAADRPPDAVCLDQLMLNHSFTDSAAHNFLKVYDATIDFAGLSDSDSVDDNGGDLDANEGSNDGSGNDSENPPPIHKVEIQMGERELTTGLLSKNAGFRLIVNGKIGAKEIDRLIAKLELDKEILAEPDPDDTEDEITD